MDRAELRRCASWCALLVVALIGSAVDGQEPKRTVWDGVYTAAQAERGRSAYAQSCASCHAEDLRGKGTAPSLVEESFLFLWSDMSVGDLFERTRMLMPSDRPGSLRADAAGLAAFAGAALRRASQVTDENPLAGGDGRAELLSRLGRVVAENPRYFGKEAPRLGNLGLHLLHQRDAAPQVRATLSGPLVSRFAHR